MAVYPWPQNKYLLSIINYLLSFILRWGFWNRYIVNLWNRKACPVQRRVPCILQKSHQAKRNTPLFLFCSYAFGWYQSFQQAEFVKNPSFCGKKQCLITNLCIRCNTHLSCRSPQYHSLPFSWDYCDNVKRYKCNISSYIFAIKSYICVDKEIDICYYACGFNFNLWRN